MAIEILSPEDRLNAVTERAQEYLEFGMEYVWIVDPKKRLVHRLTPAGLERTPSGEIVAEGTPIRVVLSELFAELDRV
jgi:Uma2 family endonuclease